MALYKSFTYLLRLLDCLEPRGDKAAIAIENIADAVTHARFVGTDPGSDEVVLMKILHVCILTYISFLAFFLIFFEDVIA